MGTQVFYFTGTGNSLELAKDVAQQLDGSQLISIPTVLGKEIDLADTIGLVFPVYAWGVPRIIIDFVKQLRFKGNEYVFALVTCGGNPAGTLPQLAKLLKEQGVTLQAGFSVVQPDNYILWHGALPVEKQAGLFTAKANRISGIVDVVKNKKSAPLEQNSPPINFVLGLVYKAGISHFAESDKNFRVTERCTQCGQCTRICPRANITLEEGAIRWHHDCEMCLACIQWCPKEAIQYKKKTEERQRYHHPAVKVQDLYLR